ncbi:AAA family ATPase [Diaminobutyricibacter tongyongensis]|uniref:AAA family ATPase n=1 Tax=Leifsonia tongyongensis TaxID=1268043 RepID=A0A6L9Y0C7_9MICO|nr:LuxR family transcriptional regulator [Diaminobutyricibacter tongyongensis]NEN07093.1 AAA family ATPase [Diaminobutyricibacter tongyongensis]
MPTEEVSAAEQIRISPVPVGRDDLLALAERRWTAAAAGDGHLLLLAGEAGIGKSRLLDDIASRTGGVRTRLGAAAFRRGSEIVGGVLLELAADLRRAHQADVADRLRGVIFAGAEGGDSARRRRVLVTDLADILVEFLETSGPTLLSLEDLHWADELSLDVFERLAVPLRQTRTLVLATYRTEELFPGTPLRQWRDRLVGQRLAEEAHVRRLDRAQTGELAEAITGTVLSSVYLDQLYARSDGIPLHVEELIAAGAVSRVPGTVAEAVMLGRGALSPHARALVDAAAVIGRSFDIDVLAGTVGESVDELDSGLTELLDRHVIVSTGDGTNFDFRHAMIRDTIYESIPPSRRRRLHEAAGVAAIVAEYCYADVSDHYERANLPDIAYGHALFAAADAARVSAHREAATLYERARRTAPSGLPPSERADLHARLAAELAAVDENEEAAEHFSRAIHLFRVAGDEVAAAAIVPRLMSARHLVGHPIESRVRLALDALARLSDAGIDQATVPPLVRYELFSALAAAYMLDRRLYTAMEYGTAAAAIRLPDDPDDVATVAARVNLNATLGAVMVFAGRMEEGWRLLESAIVSGRKAGVEAETARAFRMLGSSASVLVEYDRAERWLDDGLAYTERTERWNDHHYLASHLAHVCWARGDWQRADHEARKALADGRGGITTRVTALIVLGYLAVGRGDAAEARTVLDEARSIGEHMNELQRLSPALWGLAELALLEDRAQDAVELCDRALRDSERVGDAAYLFPFLVTGVRAHLAMHAATAARAWTARCSQLITSRGIPGTLPALEHADGLLASGETHWVQAREHLESALSGWEERHRFWESAQASIDLAAALNRSRRGREAAEASAHARALARQAGAQTLERRADALGVRTAPESGIAPLSEREFEVAALIAAGATNKEIGATLTIAPKTVGAHVEHILAKLDASRRSEIAAWVAEHRVESH